MNYGAIAFVLTFAGVAMYVQYKFGGKPKKRSHRKRQSSPDDDFYKYVKRLPERP